MAPELRKRKEKAPVEAPKTTAMKKGLKAEKRKAGEDGSPVPVKKQKSTKAASATPSKKPTKAKEDEKPAAKEKKSSKKSALKEEKVAVEPTPDGDEEVLGSEDEGEDDAGEADEQTQALVRTFDPEDEDVPESKETFKKGQDVGKVPKPVKALPQKSPLGNTEPGVVYLGRIPHGFHEQEMKSYFSQFSTVTRLRLSRNKKTGKSKHYAFIEFADKEVAEIVAKTMDSYLLFGHILRARVVPPEQVHPELFKGANRRFKKVPWNKMEGRHLEKAAGETTWKTRIEKEQRRRSERAQKLKELMDYEYEGPALKAAEAKPAAIESGEEAPKAIEAPAEKQSEAADEESKPAEPAPAEKKAKSGKKASKAKKVKA